MSTVHGRHLYINRRALNDIGEGTIGMVVKRLLDKLEEHASVLLTVDDSDGIVAFGEEPCDCETSYQENPITNNANG